VKSLWNDEDAKSMVDHYAKEGATSDVALRIYTSRLLGGDPSLALHGGGNTSVKTTLPDLMGDDCEVICVKGSGWDLVDIEPAGLPALRLEPLKRFIELDRLSDEDMVNAQRGQLLNSNSPNPSVETFLHAFLPAKFVDHTHSSSVLAVTDQPDGTEICVEIFGERAPVVPYVMPGFALAKLAAKTHADNPNSEGLILLKHGIFSYGADAREAYDRMISLVSIAESRIEAAHQKSFVPANLPVRVADVASVAPIIRGAIAQIVDDEEGLWRRQILEFRTSEIILAYVNGSDLARYSQVGVITPDHTIRTKNWPLIVPVSAVGDLDGFAAAARAAVTTFVDDYHAYFQRYNTTAQSKTELDPMPRVLLVPGLGLFGAGKSAKDAKIAADIAENTISVITAAEGIGRYQPVAEADMFEIEYWSLEQAKLGTGAEAPLARHVAAVTGGGSGIGAATVAAFAAQGAEVAVLDKDGDAAQLVANRIGSNALAITCDVTDRLSVDRAFAEICRTFGGLDILVSNAGAAWQGRIGEVADEALRASFELNFFAHQHVAQAATAIFRTQSTGGVLLFNASKQAVNPGPDFGPYGLPKAATMFLSRQYALDYGVEGIRSNAVNADRIRTGMLDDAFIAKRAHARGLSPKAYMREGNLLKREVNASDVANAFVNLALARKTTGAVITVDGGNIAAALR